MFNASVGPMQIFYQYHPRHETPPRTLQPNSLAATRAVPPFPEPISIRMHLSGVVSPFPPGKHLESSSCVARRLALTTLGIPCSSASSPWSLVYRPTRRCSSPLACGGRLEYEVEGIAGGGVGGGGRESVGGEYSSWAGRGMVGISQPI